MISILHTNDRRLARTEVIDRQIDIGIVDTTSGGKPYLFMAINPRLFRNLYEDLPDFDLVSEGTDVLLVTAQVDFVGLKAHLIQKGHTLSYLALRT